MRLYCQDDTYYLSVTTLLNLYKPFNERIYKEAMWRKGIDPDWVDRKSRKLGNMVHEWIENRADEISDFFDETPRTLDEKGLKKAVDSFFDDYEVITSEKVVLNSMYKYAGRFDAKVRRKIDGKVFLADFKTWNAWRGDNSVMSFSEIKKTFRDKINKVSTQLTLYDETEKVNDLVCFLFRVNGDYEVIELKKDKKILEWIDNNTGLIEQEIARALQDDSTDIKFLDY